ncbi:unnamed protein product [Macrosiphum euphorbiae]|uniref:Uncharacterized protein n=1 Tax=Macrosiphum euphorbiae TaxID=13131 RepID=A0AAV0VPN5_9HEMI|nr:unnamed protein product [Macrosiphum euphorbiae]
MKSHRVLIPTTHEVVRRTFRRVITFSRWYRGGHSKAFNFLLGRHRRLTILKFESVAVAQRLFSSPFEPKLFVERETDDNIFVRVLVDKDSNTSLFNVRSFAVKRSTPRPAGDCRSSSQHTQGPKLETFLF